MASVRQRFDRIFIGTPPPALPTNLTVIAGDTQAALSWTAPDPAEDVTDYSVQYRTSPSGAWNTVTRTPSTAATQTVTGLTNGVTYDFRIAAIRTGVVGDYIGPVSATPTALPGPSALLATPGDSSVALSWTAPSPSTGVTDYSVQFRVSPSGAWQTFAHTASTAVSRTVTGLTNGTTYDFRVAAIRSGSVGDYTAGPVTATAAALPGPSALQATPGDGQVSLVWTAPSPSTGVTDYSNQYRLSPSGVWNTFTHAVSTLPNRTITGLTNGTAYDFRVAAVRSGSIGDYTAGPVTSTPTTVTTGDIFAEHVGFGDPGLFDPVSIVVTSNADSGPGTLRAAIAGSAHKHITFATNMTITVTSLLAVGPNTLIDGRGHNITVRGTLTSGAFILQDVWNITIAHLTITDCGNLALTSADDPWDGIIMYGSRDIWIHHCDISRCSDKAIGIQLGCVGVTVSWTHFHDQQQTFQNGDFSGGEALGSTATMTIHHCYWNGTGYRHPVLSYGKAHVFNNYYRDFELYGTRSQRIGKMHFEKNAILAIRSNKITLITGTGGADKDDRPGYLTISGNVALSGSIALVYQSTAPGTTFNPSDFYSYTAVAASQALANEIVAGVGPK